MATANELLHDASVRHQVKLMRFAEGQARRAVELLQASDDELVSLLRSQLTEASEARLKKVLAEVRRLRAAVVAELEDLIQADRLALAETEAEWEIEAIAQTCPVVLDLASPSVAALKAAAGSPLHGVPLGTWLGNMAAQDVTRIEQQIRLGMVAGETVEQMVRRIRGTRANGFKDGVTAITRRNAEAIVRTAVNQTSTQARQSVWEANADIIKGIRIVATLDGRTSPVCQAQDGKVYGIKEGPRPPFHVNCRSTTVAVLDGEQIVGERPMVRDSRTRAAREKDFREEAKAEAGDRWKNMSAQERNAAVKAKRDKWAAKNIGQVPSNKNYQEWLKEQPAAFQDEVLGKGRAELFRKGQTLDKFVDANGKPLTLAQLRAENAGDALNVLQPGVGMKAKAYLQQGKDIPEILNLLKAEFPDANPTPGSIASYKSELKKAGLLDELKEALPISAAGPAKAVADVVSDLDASLPPGLKHAIGGQWASVVDDLDGYPGAYGHYKAGKGVELSGKKLSAVPAAQARQIVAHELGHLLHKQHDLVLPARAVADMKAVAKGLPSDQKKLYGYYLSHLDELLGEIYAQALSPSPVTSQGLSASGFNKAFAAQIDLAKKAIAEKFPVPPAGAKLPLQGPPVLPYEVAGKHTSIGSLAKALLQQGMPDEDVLAAVKAEFPGAKTGLDSIKTYKSQLKKQGLLTNKASGPVVVPTKVVPETVKPLPKPEVQVAAPGSTGKQPLGHKLPLSQLKAKGIELMKEGILDNNALLAELKKLYPLNADDFNYEKVVSWKSLWKKAEPAAFAEASKKAEKAVKVATAAGPAKLPVLHGQHLTPQVRQQVDAVKNFLAAGGEVSKAKTVVAPGYQDISDMVVELAEYEVAAAKAVSKPYLSASVKPKPKPVSTPVGAPDFGAMGIDLTPARPASSPREGFPPLPRFTAEQRAAAVRRYVGRVDSDVAAKMNRVQKEHGLEPVTPEEAAAIRSYTGGAYRQLNAELRNGRYAAKYELQAYSEAAQHGLRKMPKYKGLTSRGLSLHGADLEKFLAVYQPGRIVEEAAFISASKGDNVAFGGNIYMKIQSKNGVSVQEYSYYPNEREVLYPPGTRLKIDRVEKQGDRYVVHMTEID